MPYTNEERELKENILYHAQQSSHHKTMQRRFEAIRDAKPPETVEAVTAANAEPTREQAVESVAKTEAYIDAEAARDEQARKDRAEAREAEAAEDAE